jgi:hypothetical protein
MRTIEERLVTRTNGVATLVLRYIGEQLRSAVLLVNDVEIELSPLDLADIVTVVA